MDPFQSGVTRSRKCKGETQSKWTSSSSSRSYSTISTDQRHCCRNNRWAAYRSWNPCNYMKIFTDEIRRERVSEKRKRARGGTKETATGGTKWQRGIGFRVQRQHQQRRRQPRRRQQQHQQPLQYLTTNHIYVYGRSLSLKTNDFMLLLELRPQKSTPSSPYVLPI